MIITIGGRAGSGTTSTGKALAKKMGYKFYCAGDVRRKFARDKNITLAELNEKAEKNPSSDYLVDDFMKEMAKKGDDFVIDAWIGFHFFPESIKIFLEADIKVRAKRILERADFEEHPMNLKEAIKLINAREESAVKRFEKLYSVDPFDENNYELILDTTKHSVDETADHMYKYIMHKIKK